MNILDFTGFRSREADQPDINVGTPDEPIYVPAEQRFVKTGADARRSEQARILNVLQDKGDVDPDLLLPAASRQQRRAHERASETERRKGVKRYKDRAIRTESDAAHLAQLFNVADGLVPARPLVRQRARDAIAHRVAAVVQADRMRYQREETARRANRDLPAPKPVVSHDKVRAELQLIAKIARTTTHTASARRKARRAAKRAAVAA